LQDIEWTAISQWVSQRQSSRCQLRWGIARQNAADPPPAWLRW